jgi:hypothetical protein
LRAKFPPAKLMFQVSRKLVSKNLAINTRDSDVRVGLLSGFTRTPTRPGACTRERAALMRGQWRLRTSNEENLQHHDCMWNGRSEIESLRTRTFKRTDPRFELNVTPEPAGIS